MGRYMVDKVEWAFQVGRRETVSKGMQTIATHALLRAGDNKIE